MKSGVGWGSDELIEDNSDNNVFTMFDEYAHVSIDSDGSAIAVWVQYDGLVYRVYSNRYGR